MPRAAKICSKPNCPHLQPCPEHPKEPFKGSDRRARLPKNWNQIRAKILRRDPICRVCNTARSTEVDHVQHGDDHSPQNLQGICSDCHKTKTGREANAARH